MYDLCSQEAEKLAPADAKMLSENILIFFLLTKSWKNHLKKLLTLTEIPSFQKFLFYCPTAQMAEVMVQNVAYRATVYRAGERMVGKFWRETFVPLWKQSWNPLESFRKTKLLQYIHAMIPT